LRPILLVAAFAGAFLAVGCGAWSRSANTAVAPARLPQQSLERFQLALLVRKSRQILGVYRHGELVKEYPIVVGSRPEGEKLYEGDLRTPEGLYRITRKRAHPRWRYFLELDYPNGTDLRRYERNVRDGRIPMIGDKPLQIGGNIGIHGSDRPTAQMRGKNWTKGCIALTNEDIGVLHDTVKLGTPVLVVP
jgi:murein L,D-transpeptidase YafK